MSKRKILIILLVVIGVLLLATAITIPIVLTKTFNEKEEQYIFEIESLQEQVNDFGDTTTIFVLNRNVAAGQKVREGDYDAIEIPVSMVNDSYIASLLDIEDSYYRADLTKGQPLTFSVTMTEVLTHQDRYYDVLAHMFPTGLKDGDYIDLRLRTAMGNDYIVLPKKRVERLAANTARMILNEEEIHIYNAALVDTYIYEGTIIYASLYVEPAYQDEARAYYPVSAEVLNVMMQDPNIVDVAGAEVIEERRLNFETAIMNQIDDKILSDAVSGHADAVSRIIQDVNTYREKVANGEIDPYTGEPILAGELTTTAEELEELEEVERNDEEEN